jgi:hypothetical protein
MTGPQLLLIAALALALVGTAFAFYDLGFDRGQRCEHDANQCADELRLVAESRGRHPAGRDQ